MKVRTFRDLYRSMRSAAKDDELALQIIGFVRSNADFLQVRRNVERPVRLLRHARHRLNEERVKIVVCEGHRGSGSLIEYEVICFKKDGEHYGIDGLIVSDVPSDRFWFGLSALRYFSIHMLGAHLKNNESDRALVEPVVLQGFQRMLYRLLNRRFEGALGSMSCYLIKKHRRRREAYQDELFNYGCELIKLHERSFLSQAEYRTRYDLLLEAVVGAWHTSHMQ